MKMIDFFETINYHLVKQ